MKWDSWNPPPNELKQHILQVLTTLITETRVLEVAARLLGVSLEELKGQRRERYKQAIVADARRRGIRDASWHQTWGLYSAMAEHAHGKALDSIMPDGRNGWPLIWEVAHDWGVSGCGNGFNMQVSDDVIDKVFEEHT